MMTKTLVINYTPRAGSYTKILFEEFLKLAHGKTEIKHLNLALNPPELLLEKNLNLIMQWNTGKRDFTKNELLILNNHNELVEDVLTCDYIVLAFPIYNFTMPATVKAWIDAIVVSDKTFSFNPNTGFKGLCSDKMALSIIVSGFGYDEISEIKEYATPTLKQNFDFMGISLEQITAYGVDENRDQLDLLLDNAKSQINKVVRKWYSNLKKESV